MAEDAGVVEKPRKQRRRSEHYVNNKEFTAAVVAHTQSVLLARNNGEPAPRIPDYIGECFLKIATRISYRFNFRDYVYRDEMICDAVENCCRYLNNFNMLVSENAFAYFSQYAWNAFVRRIKQEKIELYVKCVTQRDWSRENPYQPRYKPGGNADYYTQNSEEFIQKFDLAREKKKKRKSCVLTLDYLEEKMKAQEGGETI